MHTLVGLRARGRVALVICLLLLLGGAALALRASLTPTPGRSIDWQHPVHVPGPGMALSGVGSAATGDVVTRLSSSSNALAVVPQANFPSRCYRGTAYYLRINGVSVWTRTDVHTEAYVRYLWCARWAGDQVGLNFSYGRAYLITPSSPYVSCDWIGVGRNSFGAQIGGAMISTAFQPGGQKTAYDGEQATYYNICQGYYVWDYSLTMPGNDLYAAGMDAYDGSVSGDTHTIVWSPCCY